MSEKEYPDWWPFPTREKPVEGQPIEEAVSYNSNVDMWEVLEKDPSGKDPHEAGAKLDAGKTLVWLFMAGFANALEEVAAVTTVGANKYTPNGWAAVENGSDRYMQAFGRHILALGRGELVDDGPNGTGCLHKAQAAWNLLASLELDLRGND